MRIGRSAVAACAAVCVSTGIAGAQGRALTLADVVARAREQAPQVVSARLALDEARGRLRGAALLFQTNPEIDATVGSRQSRDSRFTDLEIGVGQAFEPRARRSARIAGANAAIAQGTADIDETVRVVLRSAAGAYYRALHASEHLRLLARARELAAGVHAVADRRFKAGDIAILDVEIARASLARVAAGQQAAEAARALGIGELRVILQIPEEITVAGALTGGGEADLQRLLDSAAQRPELQVLRAAVQEAEADLQLGRSFSRPEFGVGVRYAREEGDQIVLGGLRVTLPVFSSGQELRTVSAARAARLRTELEAARARVDMEVRIAFEAYSRRLAAVRTLEADAIPSVDEAETLATRSFEAGQIGLPELLLLRREILDTRTQYLDALLEAALARVELDASAALLR
jgi:outer membrane protein, heavy metal efflux system